MKYSLFIFLFISFLSHAQSIRIVDSETKKGIAHAEIEIYELSIYSLCDSNGLFDISNLPSNFNILVSARSYISKHFFIENTSESTSILSLDRSHITLDEVVVSHSTGVVQQHNLSNVSLLEIDNINQPASTNLMNMLSTVPGVHSISSGAGISKPVIRGMSGLKILTFLNGLRIENQQWANDHGLSFGEIGIKKVEIVKGPSSLLYGADALGGVLYFVDEDYCSSNNSSSSFKTKFESNSMSFSNMASYKMSRENLRFNLFAANQSFADYKVPMGDYVVNSRFKGNSVKTAIGYDNKNWILNIRYNFIANEIGLPGHTHSLNPDVNDFLSEQQNRDQATPFQQIRDHYLSIENKFLFKKSVLQLISGYTSNSLKEHEEKVTIPSIQMLLSNIPYNLRYTNYLNENLKWISGVQGMFIENKNSREALDQLIPDAKSSDYGLYSLFQYSSNQFETQLGLRYDYRSIDAAHLFKQEYSRLNGSFSAVYQKGQYTLRASISSGYRPPHLSELLAEGVHHGSNRYERGNTNLKSEYAQQLDFSIDFNNDHIKVNLNPFINIFSNYIYLKPSSEEIDGYQVYDISQTESASSYGGEFYFHYHPHFAHRLHFEQNLSYISAKDEQDKSLALIPQTSLKSTIKYEFEQSTAKVQLKNLQINRTHCLAQDNVAAYETSTEAYIVYDIEANIIHQKKQNSLLKIGIKNIFNTEYIDHLSVLKRYKIPNPGRNYYISLNFLIK